MPADMDKRLQDAERKGRMKSGLHIIAESLLPKWMNNFLGRWIIWRIIEKMTDWGFMRSDNAKKMKQPGGWLSGAKNKAPVGGGGYLSRVGATQGRWQFGERITDHMSLHGGEPIFFIQGSWIDEGDINRLSSAGPIIVRATPTERQQPLNIWLGDEPEIIETEILESGRVFRVERKAEQLQPAIDAIAEQLDKEDPALAESFEAILANATEILAAVRTIPWPKKGVYPVGINPQAKPIWDRVVVEYKQEILKLSAGDPRRGWVVAKILFERACREQKMRPFKGGTSIYEIDKQRVTYSVAELLRGAAEEVDDYQKKILRHLKQQNMLKGVIPKETFWGADFLKGRYFLSYRRFLPLEAKVNQRDLSREFRVKMGFRNIKGGLLKQISATAELIISWEPKPSMFVTYYLKPEEAQKLTGQDRHATILRELATVGRRWGQTGRLPIDINAETKTAGSNIEIAKLSDKIAMSFTDNPRRKMDLRSVLVDLKKNHVLVKSTGIKKARFGGEQGYLFKATWRSKELYGMLVPKWRSLGLQTKPYNPRDFV